MRQHRIHAAAYDTMTRPLERAILSERRARLLTGLTGQILDIGSGTGANLPHYQQASQVIAAEPDPAIRRRLTARAAAARVPVTVISDTAETLHLNRDITAAVEKAEFTLSTAETFDPYPTWVPSRPFLQALAVPQA
jgi:SAM-dependent methyltransferase